MRMRISLRTRKAAPEITALKVAMLQKGVDSHDLARITGMTLRNVQNLVSGCNRGRESRAKINKALGLEIFNQAGARSGLKKGYKNLWERAERRRFSQIRVRRKTEA